MSTNDPKDREVPIGAGVMAPATEQKTSIKVPKDREVPFWSDYARSGERSGIVYNLELPNIVRPVIDREKCALCFTCVMVCPDSCWSFNEKGRAGGMELEVLQRLPDLYSMNAAVGGIDRRAGT